MSLTSIADPMVPSLYRVRHVKRELPGIVTLELASQESGVPAFLPGQFNMLYAFGIGEIAISISGDPAGPDAFVHTVRDVGAASAAITHMTAGSVVGVRGPFGTAWPAGEAEGNDVVIVAGGLGLAPLRPAIYQVLANRDRYGHVAILYGTRSPAEILYRTELERWRRRLDVQVMVTVDHAGTGWHGDVGVAPKLLALASFDPAHTVAMVCGPEIMMRYTCQALADLGVPHDQIHLSMERNMKCAIGLCGHCQFGADFICKDGPVMTWQRIGPALSVREL